jgi:hypothetical protein
VVVIKKGDAYTRIKDTLEEIRTRDETTKVSKGDIREGGLEMKSNEVRCMPPRERRYMYW